MEIIKCKYYKYYNEENPREIEERVNNILSNRKNKFKSFYLCTCKNKNNKQRANDDPFIIGYKARETDGIIHTTGCDSVEECRNWFCADGRKFYEE